MPLALINGATYNPLMDRFKNPYAHGSNDTLGVLAINLGTPDAPTPSALRRYLGEFLWDPRVVEMARLPWWLILHGIILRTRPKRSARLYEKVWQADGSPLLAIARGQTRKLESELARRLERPTKIALGMRYGNPSIAAALTELAAAGCTRIVALPLYPQYSATTTASSFDALFDELKGWRRQPELRLIAGYHDHPGHLDALAASVRDHWTAHGRGDRLLFSFHGIPLRYARAGDPYPEQCRRTAAEVATRLELSDEEWAIAFQSRLGKEEWLRPYTDETLATWPSQGIRRVQVLCPGFSADCLETLEEIAGENRETFLAAGGDDYHYIPALNDRDDHIAALAGLVMRHAAGWGEQV
ncbi:ferrochelatase [Endothiovibrio diazotrophicus]